MSYDERQLSCRFLACETCGRVAYMRPPWTVCTDCDPDRMAKLNGHSVTPRSGYGDQRKVDVGGTPITGP